MTTREPFAFTTSLFAVVDTHLWRSFPRMVHAGNERESHTHRNNERRKGFEMNPYNSAVPIVNTREKDNGVDKGIEKDEHTHTQI